MKTKSAVKMLRISLILILTVLIMQQSSNPVESGLAKSEYRTTENTESIKKNPKTIANDPHTDNIELVGQIGGVTRAVDVVTDTVFLGVGRRLITFDVTDENNPVILGQTPILTDTVNGVEVVGNYAYIANGINGLGVVDVSDPTHPFLTSHLDTPNSSFGLAISGTIAYLADREGGLRIVNITDPFQPTFMGVTTNTTQFASKVAVAGNYAYLADPDSGLRTIDISDPYSPTEVDLFYTPNGVPRDVAIRGNYLYLAFSLDGLLIMDIATNPADPQYVTALPTSEYGAAFGITLSGNYALVVDFEGGSGNLCVFDISVPINTYLVGSVEFSGMSYDLASINNYAYVADLENGLRIFNTASPASPVPVAFFPLPGRVTSLAGQGNYAYYSAEDSGFGIVDIEDPTTPVMGGFYPKKELYWSTAVSGTYAYVGWTGGYDMLILDVSNPLSPTLATTFHANGDPFDIELQGNLAYLASNESGLHIIDVSDPPNPVQVGGYSLSDNYSNGVDVQGNYAYLSSSPHGVDILDVSDPTSPVVVGTIITDTDDVEVYGQFAYVIYNQVGFNKMCIYQITDPAYPEKRACYESNVNDIKAKGMYAYIAGGRNGLRVLNIEDPYNPVEVGYYKFPDNREGEYSHDDPMDISLLGDYLLVACGDGGLYIFHFLEPAPEATLYLPMTIQ